MSNQTPDSTTRPLVSEFASDPDMAELVTLFLSELPQRLGSIAEFWRNKNLREVQRVAHQLKGASAGYGFPTIGLAASKVEDRLRGADPTGIPEQLAAINNDINELVDLCRRALHGQAAS